MGSKCSGKLSGLIGKPLRTDRPTTQKDILEYAKVLVEIDIEEELPDTIQFVNEKGIKVSLRVEYECKPIIYGDCKGIGHTVEQGRKRNIKLLLKR